MASRSDVEVFCDSGVLLRAGYNLVAFDSRRDRFGTSVLVSHAHIDHLPPSSVEAYATPQTAEIARAKGKRNRFLPIAFDKPLRLYGELEVIPKNAGHMLGSAQFVVASGEGVLVYTGDLNLANTLVTKGAEPISCDVLVIESTYGKPFFRFPHRDEVYRDIVKWVFDVLKEEKIPTFTVYSAGKAQEIIKLINLFLELPVVAHERVARICEAYQKFGFRLQYIPERSEEGREVLFRGSCVYVAPVNAPLMSSRMVRAVATGWAVAWSPKSCSAAFPLSSHADFSQLERYVLESGAKKVFTCMGYAREFAEYLRRKHGIEAQPLRPKQQQILS